MELSDNMFEYARGNNSGKDLTDKEKFLTLGILYFSQVCNGGHCQYHGNGYASRPDEFLNFLEGVKDCADEQEKIMLSTLQVIISEFKANMQVYDQNVDKYDCDEDDESWYSFQSVNEDLDTRFYKFSDDFEKFLIKLEESDLNFNSRPCTLEKPFIKPTCKWVGENGNTVNLVAICSKALRKAGYKKQADEMAKRVFKMGTSEGDPIPENLEGWQFAHQIMQEYVNVY